MNYLINVLSSITFFSIMFKIFNTFINNDDNTLVITIIMKIINDDKAYTTSILLLVLLVPIMLLIITAIDQYSHDVNNTVEKLESDKIRSIASDFEDEITRITKQSLHNITYETVTTGRSTGRDKIIRHVQDRINMLNTDPRYEIECQVFDIRPSDDPFKIELTYFFEISTQDNKIRFTKNNRKPVEITDKNYPVYDPLPTLKTGARFREGYVFYQNKLSEYVISDTHDIYVNVKQHIIIRECPINDYGQHGNSNESVMFCLNNQYYHNSHDGMCLLCRLENRTGCNHNGLETFILPTDVADVAPTSIDHVLLNDRNNQYPGNMITINNNTKLYLDNGHKTKYGL